MQCLNKTQLIVPELLQEITCRPGTIDLSLLEFCFMSYGEYLPAFRRSLLSSLSESGGQEIAQLVLDDGGIALYRNVGI